MMEHEVFVFVPGYSNGYMVSNAGRVLSLKSASEIRPFKCRNGYYSVSLRNGKAKHNRLVHRLVAAAFVPNDERLPEVNHINGDKTDNRAENLEWCTRKQNMEHASENGLLHTPKRMAHLDDITRIAADNHKRPVIRDDGEYFDSIHDAARAIGASASNVSAVCRGKYKSCMGFTFRYAADEERGCALDIVRRAKALAGIEVGR